MRFLFSTLLIFSTFFIQINLFELISIFHIKPNMVIISIVSYSILRGDIEGAIFGFFLGLLQDVFFGNSIGLYALFGTLLGFFSGKPLRGYYNDNFLLPIIMVSTSVLVYEFSFYCFVFLFRGDVDIILYLTIIILPEMIYTTLLAWPVYKIIFILNSKLEAIEYNRKNMY